MPLIGRIAIVARTPPPATSLRQQSRPYLGALAQFKVVCLERFSSGGSTGRLRQYDDAYSDLMEGIDCGYEEWRYVVYPAGTSTGDHRSITGRFTRGDYRE